jgi:hypothetical protein
MINSLHTPAVLPQVKDLDTQLKRRLGGRQSSSAFSRRENNFLPLPESESLDPINKCFRNQNKRVYVHVCNFIKEAST